MGKRAFGELTKTRAVSNSEYNIWEIMKELQIAGKRDGNTNKCDNILHLPGLPALFKPFPFILHNIGSP